MSARCSRIQYAKPLKNLRVLFRVLFKLFFLCEAGCVLHKFQYNNVVFVESVKHFKPKCTLVHTKVPINALTAVTYYNEPHAAFSHSGVSYIPPTPYFVNVVRGYKGISKGRDKGPDLGLLTRSLSVKQLLRLELEVKKE